jgi:hypothetical protein
MTIHIELSDRSINSAIRALEKVNEHIQQGLEETIEILCREGTQIANSSYQGMASATYGRDGTHGVIIALGDQAIVAEFGAGDDTIAPMFENQPTTPVYPGSWSEQNTKEYATYGSWHYHGERYVGIPAKRGLANAVAYIKTNSTDVALGAIKL